MMDMKPLPPVYEQDKQTTSNDRAKGGFPLRTLERILSDNDLHYNHRQKTEIAYAYYDGDNVTPEMESRAKAYGFTETRNKNLVSRVINTVLGQEEKSRRDPKLDADEDEFSDVADVLNVRLKEAQRETNADQEIGSSYASQVKGGLGWCGVYKRADPYQYQYAIEDIPWQEMDYDRRAKRIDLSDRAWDSRAQWKDLADVLAMYPEHKDDIKAAMNGSTATWANDDQIEDVVHQSGYGGTLNTSWFRTRRNEWMEGSRDRIRMYEVEYKVPAIVAVMRVAHRWICVDKSNPAHIEAISRGMVELKKVPTNQYRRAIFAGPIRLSDEPTKLNKFSRVPFVAFRRDMDKSTYGLIEGMISPQDDYNDASMRVRWILQATQLMMDSDAVDTNYNSIADITDNMMRSDMVAILNPGRQNRDKGLHFRNDFELKRELFDRQADSERLVQGVPGIFNASMGNGQPGTSSGIAISSLVEQGMVSMGELNGNYAYSRRMVFELLLDLIAEDHAERNMTVRIGSGAARREVVLNTQDQQTGRPMNMVKDAPIKLGLGEVPSSPAYQIQQSQQIGDMIRALAGTPQAAVLIPSWVEQTSAFGPDRKKIAEDMRKVAGLPAGGDKSGAEQFQAQQQKIQAQQAQMQAELAQISMQLQQAKVAETMARAKKTESDAALNIARVAQVDQQVTPTEEQLIQQALQEAMA